jgi:hypothetical protein
MHGPLVAIIGSPWKRDPDGTRLTDADAVKHESRVRAACEALGRELAKAGCRLIVYSAEEHSIEPDVVRGFVAVDKTRHAIEFHHAKGMAGRFPAQDLPEAPINDRNDPSYDWVASFFGSLGAAEGVLLVGGRSTVQIAGHVAMTFEIPVAAAATFDGAAADIWRALEGSVSLTTEEYDSMARDWGSNSARDIVKSLVRRHSDNEARRREEAARAEEFERLRRLDAERRSEGRAVAVTFGTAAVAVATLFGGFSIGRSGIVFAALLVVSVAFFGMTGAGLRYIRTATTDSMAKGLLTGTIAGLVFSLLSLAPQMVADQSLLTGSVFTPGLRWQVVLASFFGLAGGLAGDAVLGALQKDVESHAGRVGLAALTAATATGDAQGPKALPSAEGAADGDAGARKARPRARGAKGGASRSESAGS